MFISTMLFQATNKNLLLGFMPESLGLLLFGVGLIIFAASLRWLFNRNEEIARETLSNEMQGLSEEI